MMIRTVMMMNCDPCEHNHDDDDEDDIDGDDDDDVDQWRAQC